MNTEEVHLKPQFFDLNLSEMTAWFTEQGESAFRAKQLWQAIYKQGITDPKNITVLSKPLQEKLTAAFDFSPVSCFRSIRSSDFMTDKLILELVDRQMIEAVLMRYTERNTICISTQVGCAMHCAFCATGQMGFTRNLSAGEIIGQVMYFSNMLQEENKRLTNIVVMGMGEPFHNYEAVMKAIAILNDPDGFQFSERRITISTVGIIPMIEKFTKAKTQINLAVSLHAPNSTLRSELMPADRKYPLAELIEACKNYTEKTNRRITFEYALIRGVNDSYKEAEQLSKLLKGMLCHVNLIPLNATKAYDKTGSPRERVAEFKMVLDRAGIPCSIRLKRGVDIGAGCGQLLYNQKKGVSDFKVG